MVAHPESVLARLEAKIDDLAARLARLEDPGRHASLPAPPDILDIPGKRSQRVPAFWDDPEVRQWVIANIWQKPLDRLHAEAARTFGKKRAPSRSALHRYQQNCRKALRAKRSKPR